MSDKTILIVGTYDTKDDELSYLADRIRQMGGGVVTMDVSVLGEPSSPCDLSKYDVALAGDSTIQATIDTGEENLAMQIMARGSARLTADLHAEGRIDGVIVLGGNNGHRSGPRRLSGSAPSALPNTSFQPCPFPPLIPAERLSPDIQMILWAGGLYGLNSVCKSSLSQAAGAVLGAARAVEKPTYDRPVVGMTSLGSSLSFLHETAQTGP